MTKSLGRTYSLLDFSKRERDGAGKDREVRCVIGPATSPDIHGVGSVPACVLRYVVRAALSRALRPLLPLLPPPPSPCLPVLFSLVSSSRRQIVAPTSFVVRKRNETDGVRRSRVRDLGRADRTRVFSRADARNLAAEYS